MFQDCCFMSNESSPSCLLFGAISLRKDGITPKLSDTMQLLPTSSVCKQVRLPRAVGNSMIQLWAMSRCCKVVKVQISRGKACSGWVGCCAC